MEDATVGGGGEGGEGGGGRTQGFTKVHFPPSFRQAGAEGVPIYGDLQVAERHVPTAELVAVPFVQLVPVGILHVLTVQVGVVKDQVPPLAEQTGTEGEPWYPGAQVGSVHVPLVLLAADPVQMILSVARSLHVFAVQFPV